MRFTTAFVALLALAASAAALSIGESFTGEATYYGAGQDARAACGGNGLSNGPGGEIREEKGGAGVDRHGTPTFFAHASPSFFFPLSSSPPLSPFSGVVTVALNSPQYGDGKSACGRCIEGSGTGVGAGGTPVGRFFAAVNNLCPECKTGDIDFALNGDGRWKVNWKVVDCSSKSGRRLLYDTMRWAAALSNGTLEAPATTGSRKELTVW